MSAGRTVILFLGPGAYEFDAGESPHVIEVQVPQISGTQGTGTSPVLSVNGQGGNVVLDAGDVGADPAGSAAAAQAAAIQRANHTGTQAISTVSGLQSALDGKATAAQGDKADTALQSVQEGANVTIDDTDPLNPVISASGDVPAERTVSTPSSGGLSGGGDLSADRTLSIIRGTGANQTRHGNDAAYTDARTPTSHASTHEDGGPDEITVSVSQLDTTGSPDGTKFLRDDGAWENPPGGGGGAVDSVNGQTGEVVLDADDVGAAHAVHGHTGDEIEITLTDPPATADANTVHQLSLDWMGTLQEGQDDAFEWLGSLQDETDTLKTGMPLVDRDAPGETRWTFTEPVVEVTYAERIALDLDYWPDGNFDLDLMTGGTGHVYGPNGPNTAKWTFNPFTGDVVQSVVNANITISGHSYDYASIGQVLRHPEHTGVLIGIVHVETNYTDPEPGDGWYHAALGMARSSDNGATWSYMGDIITTARPFEDNWIRNVDVGPGSKIIIDGYLYVFFQETWTNGRTIGLSLARCSMSDLADAIDNNEVPDFYKWSGSSWDEDGIGGEASNIFAFDDPMTPQSGSFSTYRTGPVTAPPSDGSEPNLFVYSTRLDGKMALFIRTYYDPTHMGRATQITPWVEVETLYLAAFPLGPNVLKVYFTSSVAALTGGDRWSDAELKSVTLTYHPVPDVYLSESGKGFVDARGNSAAPRPTQFASVEWLCETEPDNWIDADTWIEP